MRFTSTVKPTLTPLGHRLLNLSEAKLSTLEPGIGGRDTASVLWKGVVVREAVKSAWKSVDTGSLGEMNDWHSKSAMGLNVIGEDGEEEEEEGEASVAREERWFEDLMSTFGDEEGDEEGGYQHEWAESNVGGAFDNLEDVEYDEEGMEAYTLPARSPTLSPTRSPISPAIAHVTVSVEAVEVDGEDEAELDIVDDVGINFHVETFTPLAQPAQPILTPLARPLAPTPTPAGTSPISPLFLSPFPDDLDTYAEDFLLPPRLIRTLSSSSTSTMPDDECLTPPLGSAELEQEQDMGYEEEEEAIENGFSMTKKSFAHGWLGLDMDPGDRGGLRLVF